jgi:DNA polymerase-3 subunit alpha
MVRIDDAIAAAVADAQPALALTDLANVFGLVKFYRAARERGVKPIVGCDVWLTHESERDAPFRALLLCASRAGYLRRANGSRVPIARTSIAVAPNCTRPGSTKAPRD